MNFEMEIDGIEYSVKVQLDIGMVTLYPLDFENHAPIEITDSMIDQVLDAIELLDCDCAKV